MLQYILVFTILYTPLFLFEQYLTIKMRKTKSKAKTTLKALRVFLFMTLTVFLSFILFSI